MMFLAECLSLRFGIQEYERLFIDYNTFESADIRNEDSYNSIENLS